MMIMTKKHIPGGIITDVGNTTINKTGTWRTFRPIVDKDKCIGCGICERFCPDGCIEIINKKCEIDYDYCKGCLICMNECPVKAIDKEIEKK